MKRDGHFERSREVFSGFSKKLIRILYFWQNPNMQPDHNFLIKLANTKMPYGKYEGRYLIDLPEYYVVWYHNKGFPKGNLGLMLQQVYELKINGLEYLVRDIKERFSK